MELFKLQGVIEVDNTEAKKKLNETSEQGGKAQSSLSGFFSKIGKGAAVVGKAVAGGMAAAGTAIAGLVTQSVSAYAEYEQLVGGIDTLFKDSSAKVQQYAADAYKNVGLSANDYMSTVTSFSATLLQGLNGDTSKAAEYANRAIQDMSDNANKMGTDMSMIQNAYQGFAKQNYTMLDNLKLGYGGSAGEMARLINESGVLGEAIEVTAETVKNVPFDQVISAIGVIQDRMGITGTTAKEAAGTLSGSMASVKASWANLITAMASDNLDLDTYINNFVSSVTTAASNMIPRIGTALTGAVSLIQKLAPTVIKSIPELLSQLLPSVITAAVELINSIVGILPSLIDLLVNTVIPQLLSGLATVITTLVSALPSVIEAIASALPTLLPILVDALVSVILTLCTTLPQIIQPIIDNLPSIIENLLSAVIGNLPIIIQGLLDLVIALVPMIPELLLILIEAITQTYPALMTTAIMDLLPSLLSGLAQLVVAICKALPDLLKAVIMFAYANVIQWFTIFKTAFPRVSEWLNTHVIQPIAELFSGLWEKLKGIWDTICNVVKVAFEFIGSIISAAFDIITLPYRFIWENCKEYVFAAFEWIKEKINNAITAVKTIVLIGFNFVKEKIIIPIMEARNKAIEIFINIATAIQEKIAALRDKVTAIFNAIKTKIITPILTAREQIIQAFEKIKSNITSKIDAVKEKVTTVFDNIKEKITKPVEEAKNKVKEYVDKIKGFFDGFSAKIKLPHFTIKNASLNPKDWIENGIPKLSVEWYKEGGIFAEGIMERPTAFGISPTGALRVGGEAGAEAVAPISKLQEYVQVAATSGNAEIIERLDTLISLLTLYLPYLMNTEIKLDGDTVVGELIRKIDKALGELSAQKARGRA